MRHDIGTLTHDHEPAKQVPLSKFAVRGRGSVDPKKFPDEEFDLFSIPAYDEQVPERIRGSEIGSAKKEVLPGDVLISRIVPHIQRVWVVPEANGRRQIASGEWLIFRGEKASPNFLRHMLLARPFHHEFMQTVAGVGGSLLRARPSEVERIEIPLPEAIGDQQRIATILDNVESLNAKCACALRMADDFLRSAFIERFGHPLDPKNQQNAARLGDCCDFFAGNSLPKGMEFTGQKGGLFLIKVSDLNAPGNEVSIRTAKLWVPDRSFVKGGIIAPCGSVLFPKRGGAIATNKKRVLDRDCVLDPNLMAVAPKPGSGITNNFLRIWFELIDLTSISSGSSVPQLNKKDLAPLVFSIPNEEEVEWFNEVFVFVDGLKRKLRKVLGESGQLSASLSQRAFRGEL